MGADTSAEKNPIPEAQQTRTPNENSCGETENNILRRSSLEEIMSLDEK
jgi:hypothetical protein